MNLLRDCGHRVPQNKANAEGGYISVSHDDGGLEFARYGHPAGLPFRRGMDCCFAFAVITLWHGSSGEFWN